MSDRPDERPTILYVEDDNDTRPVMKRLLNRSGYRVILNINEQDVLDRASDGRVAADLILMDFGWPTADVLAAGRRIRQQATRRCAACGNRLQV